MSARAVLHTTGPRVHYARYLEDNRLSGPFRSKRAAQAAVDAANAIEEPVRWAQVWTVTTHGSPLYCQGGGRPGRPLMTRAEALATMPQSFTIFTAGRRVHVGWSLAMSTKET